MSEEGNNNRRWKTTTEVRENIERMTANDPTLSYVHLGERNLSAAEAVEVGTALQSNTHVTRLNLRGNDIGDDGVRALAEKLLHNSSLTELSIGRNSIGINGVRALAGMLPHSSSLVSLYLDDNKIGDEGVTVLAEMLSRNSSLKVLHLRRNDIGDGGARTLGEALPHISSLAELDLSSNNVGIDGARALAGAIACNSALASLDLQWNKIGEEGLRAFVSALSTNCNLICLVVGLRLQSNERALKAEMERLLECNKKEQKLLHSWPRAGVLSSCPVLLHAAGKFCSLRAVYRLFRERPDILRAPSGGQQQP